MAEINFPHRVTGHTIRDKVRSSITKGEVGVEPLLLHFEVSHLRWPRSFDSDASWNPHWKDCTSWLACEHFGILPDALEEVTEAREVLLSLLTMLIPCPDSRKAVEDRHQNISIANIFAIYW